MQTNMLELKKAMQLSKASLANTSLLYGGPSTGKTGLAGTVAKMPQYERIWLFDADNGCATLLNPDIGLTDAELAKIQIIPLADTKACPVAIETMLKYFSSKESNVKICKEHTRIDCPECAPRRSVVNKPKVQVGKALSALTAEAEQPDPAVDDKFYTIPTIKGMTSADCIIIDTISQVAVSAGFAGEELQRREEATTGRANAYGKYMKQGELLTDLLSMIQATRGVCIICTAHSYTLDEEVKDKPTLTVPAIGTQNFSRNVAKFFSNKVYMEILVKKFRSYSSPDAKLNVVAGSRLGQAVEKLPADHRVCMADILTLKTGE